MDDLDPANYTMKPPKSAPQTPLAAPKAFIPDMSDDELRKLSREKLSEALQAVDAVTAPEMTRKLCAELMDRLDGKPAQIQTVDMSVRGALISFSTSDDEILRQYMLQNGKNLINGGDNAA